MKIVPRDHWYLRPVEAVVAAFETGEEGLRDAEVASRRRRFGANVVETERKRSWWTVALRQFRDPLIYILLFAGAVTAALGDFTDTGVIAAAVIVNAVIGFVQEVRARDAMRALARLTPERAVVLRSGRERTVAAADLVPGDVAILTSGARVPADLRLTSANALQIDESSLTGESFPVAKVTDAIVGEALVPGDQTNMAFAGTVVSRGRGRGIVVRTGASTELGRIASEVESVGVTTTPLQEKFNRFGRLVANAILLLSLVAIALGVLRRLPAREIFLTSVAMAVSAIPEGLPAVLTITLAMGARQMARRRAIIRSLPAVETLGSTTVIGSDKTGTLTRNEMTVRAIWSAERLYTVSGVGYARTGRIDLDGEPRQAPHDRALTRTLRTAVLANESEIAISGSLDDLPPGGCDPTEVALFVAALKGGLDPVLVRQEDPRLDLLPFESERRFMASLHDSPDGPTLHMKGAPEAVLDRCDFELLDHGEVVLDRRRARATAAALAAQGYRVLATAERHVSESRIDERKLTSGFTLSGFFGLEDPPRPEAIRAVSDARQAGIRILMLTGDHEETARAIAVATGLATSDGRVVSGHDIGRLSDEDLDRLLTNVTVFARVAPEHKLRIVQRLKERGEVVAVTGDGVNDAPALRAAHLGIAMGASGTDVAREAAHMVLADDNFATITAAVEEGRIVFANIRKATFFLLSTAAGEIITIIAALVAGLALPFTAAQILWINLVTDSLESSALAFEPGEPELLRQRPRPLSEGVLTRRHVSRLFVIGALMAIATLGMFWWVCRSSGSIDLARTAAVTQLVVLQFYHVFNCRSLDRSIFSIPLFSNRVLFVSMVAVTLAHVAALSTPFLQRVMRFQPLGASEWVPILIVGLSVIVGGELDKAINRRRGAKLG